MKFRKITICVLLIAFGLIESSCDRENWRIHWEVINDSQDTIQTVLRHAPDISPQFHHIALLAPGASTRGDFESGEEGIRPSMSDVFAEVEIYQIVGTTSTLIQDGLEDSDWQLIDEEGKYQKYRWVQP